VEKKIRRLGKQRVRTVALLRRADRQYQALLTLAGANDEKGFRKAAADCDRSADLKRQRDEWTLRIAQQLAGQFKEEAIAEVFHREGRDIRPRWDERQKLLAEIRAKLGHLHERRGACTHEMQALAADKQQGHTLQELGQVDRDLAASIRRWKVLTIIGQVLEVVRKRYETDRQPQTLREASEYLHRLTDGHYRRIWMPLENRNLRIETGKGESLPLDILSRGTREAVFIALRLALVTSFARRGTTLPLVLDDVLVNFDSGRVRLAAEVLCDFARSGHQIIMFTCHEHITDIFEEARAEIRVLPHRGEEVDPRPVKRRKKAVAVPPPVKAEPIQPKPIPPQRPDPNPLLNQAADEEHWFADVLDLPPKSPAPMPPIPQPLPVLPKVKKSKAASRYKIVPRDWNRDQWPLAHVAKAAPPPPPLELPDQWPVADAPQPPRVVQPYFEPVEYLAYRALPASWEIADVPPVPVVPPPVKLYVAPPEPTPPPPKLATARRELRQRFTWESPEMYHEDHATD
jgi:hypothetical protein